jgi:hypothetical protein
VSFWKGMLTTDDNQTGDIVRVSMALSSLCHIALTIHGAVWGGHPYDPIAFAGGQSAIMTAGGGALLLKKTTEPKTDGASR